MADNCFGAVDLSHTHTHTHTHIHTYTHTHTHIYTHTHKHTHTNTQTHTHTAITWVTNKIIFHYVSFAFYWVSGNKVTKVKN